VIHSKLSAAVSAKENTSERQLQPVSADPAQAVPKTTRRDFLRTGGMLSLSSLMGTAALMTMSDDAHAAVEWAEHFQKNYRLMTDKEKAESRARLERRYSSEYGKQVTVDTTDAQPGMLMGYALNIRKCIGCRRCVHACVAENNQSRGTRRAGEKIEWIQVLRMERGKFDAGKMNQGYPEGLGIQVGGNAYTPAGLVLEGQYHYNPEKVPEDDANYMPIACMQCEKPPCVKVCPVRTTYRDPDGVVVIDYNWCIGCRMCMGACPYWARRLNVTNPVLPKEEMNPVTHYLGNRPRMRGVVEKCHWCLQRSRHNRYPACVEVCPVGARKFGNLLDPQSEVSLILARKNVFRLKADLNTFPKFFYFYD
jgi:molybdopterin-containing oxidoreductase family iron-sulfur binding subunit